MALTVAACLAAAVPAIVSMANGLAAGAFPNGDRGIIATRAYDVLTAHTPLVGQYSASSLVVQHATYSLGPMLYWLLAVPSRLGGPAAMTVTMGLFDAAAAALVVLVARRRGGRVLMLVAAVAVALMCRSLVAETYHDIWNPSAGVLPLTLALFLCWSLACGDHQLLPLAVVVASFAAQCELTYALPALGALAIGIGGLAVSRRSVRRRWWLAGLLVAVLCWIGPLVDQAIHRPGNLVLVGRAAFAHEPALGASAGWHALVRTVGVPPWWLTIPSGPFDRLAAVRSAPAIASAVACALILCALLVVTVLGLRRRLRDVAGGGLIALLLCAGVATVASSTPTRPILVQSLGYTLWWGSPAGMFVWLVLGFSLVRLLSGRLRPFRLPAIAPVGAACAALAVAAAVAAAERSDQDRAEYQPIRTVVSRVSAAVPSGTRVVRVAGSPSFTAFDFKGAIVYALRREGRRPVVLHGTLRLGRRYEARGRAAGGTVYVWDGPPKPRHGWLVARVGLATAIDHEITVTFAPAGGRRHPA